MDYEVLKNKDCGGCATGDEATTEATPEAAPATEEATTEENA